MTYPSNRLLRVGEVARMLGVSKSYIYKLSAQKADFPAADCTGGREQQAFV